MPSDLKASDALKQNPFEILDALDKNALFEVVKKHGITQVYHLAAMLSATGEQNPAFAWKLNMESLFHVLDLAKEKLSDYLKNKKADEHSEGSEYTK